MGLIKRIARHQVLPMAMCLGSDRLIRRLSEHKILNVMYHGVVRTDATWFSPRHMTVAMFDEQLKYLVRNFEVISLAEAFHRRRSGMNSKRYSVTISFDDGYVNNLTNALPLIEKYRVPVTFFVVGESAEPTGQRILWPDVIACLERLGPIDDLMIDGKTFRNFKEPGTGMTLFEHMKRMPPDKRDHSLSRLWNDYGIERRLERIEPEIWRLMDPSQLKTFASSPYVEIGSHGHMHYNLGLIPVSAAVQDMSRSKQALEVLLDKPVVSIAYPDGSYSAAVKDAAQAIGFERQLAVGLLLKEDANDARILPRHGIPSTTTSASALFFMNKAFKTKGFC